MSSPAPPHGPAQTPARKRFFRRRRARSVQTGRRPRFHRHPGRRAGWSIVCGFNLVFGVPPGGNIRLQAPQKLGWGRTAAARRGRAVHKSFRIEIIGVNKAGIEHPRIEAGGEAIAWQWRAMRSGRRYLLFPTIAWRELLFQTPQKCACPLRVGLRAAIWQAAVVPGYGKGYLRLPGIERDLGPGGGRGRLWARLADAAGKRRCISRYRAAARPGKLAPARQKAGQRLRPGAAVPSRWSRTLWVLCPSAEMCAKKGAGCGERSMMSMSLLIIYCVAVYCSIKGCC